MTYKDHGKVAEIFRKHLEDANKFGHNHECEYDAITALVDDFAAYAVKDQPRFDRDKFYLACGIGLV